MVCHLSPRSKRRRHVQVHSHSKLRRQKCIVRNGPGKSVLERGHLVTPRISDFPSLPGGESPWAGGQMSCVNHSHTPTRTNKLSTCSGQTMLNRSPGHSQQLLTMFLGSVACARGGPLTDAPKKNLSVYVTETRYVLILQRLVSFLMGQKQLITFPI